MPYRLERAAARAAARCARWALRARISLVAFRPLWAGWAGWAGASGIGSEAGDLALEVLIAIPSNPHPRIIDRASASAKGAVGNFDSITEEVETK